jgi:hypothetical protein
VFLIKHLNFPTKELYECIWILSSLESVLATRIRRGKEQVAGTVGIAALLSGVLKLPNQKVLIPSLAVISISTLRPVIARSARNC